MIGMAQQLFLEKFSKLPWKVNFSKQEIKWPLLEKMLEAKYLNYVDFALAKRIQQGIKSTDQASAALICHLSMASRQGHLCATIDKNKIIPSPQDIWRTEENSFGSGNTPLPDELWQELFSLIIQASELVHSPLICNAVENTSCLAPVCKWKNNYYLQRYWELESHFINNARSLLAIHTSDETLPVLNVDMEKVHFVVDQLQNENKLLQEQATAIVQGCEKPFTIITGGPGTGKTYTAGILLRTFWECLPKKQRQSCRIKLAAPTGKAAANLESSIKKAFKGIEECPTITAQTLHLLLDVRKNSRLKIQPMLDADILLIDESSMIDVNLMGKLFAALKPGSRIILLGDHHQLPPVEAGSLFTDLVNHLQSSSFDDKSLVVELKTCMRAELKSIVEAAACVNKGHAEELFKILTDSTCEIRYTLLEEDSTPQKIQKKLLNYAFSHFPQLKKIPENFIEALQNFSRYRILTPLRNGPLGTEQLNSLFLAEASSLARDAEYLVAPIMIARNHYRLELFNGEVGLLVKHHISSDKDFALFPSKGFGEVRKIPALMLPAFEYAYCISIHKSQGSEFDHVHILLTDGCEKFGREALYTGITRARQALDIWSLPNILQKMMERPVFRHSGVGDRLER